VERSHLETLFASQLASGARAFIKRNHAGAAQPEVVLKSQPHSFNLTFAGVAAKVLHELRTLRQADGINLAALVADSWSSGQVSKDPRIECGGGQHSTHHRTRDPGARDVLSGKI
jgi:hypothetical protein